MSKTPLEQKALDDLQEVIDRQKYTDSDVESDHSRADEVLCEFLLDLGYEDIVAAFKRVDKWYA